MNEIRPLFDDAEYSNGGGHSNSTPVRQFGIAEHRTKIQRSALWAAYGDALGWISELTNENGLKRRTSGTPLEKPLKWTRRIGGPVGVTVSLPIGCYSDDSQLRLATARAIRSDGFDVEAFAKVELPTWLSYALGGGKSTSAAASNLANPRVQWFANTFKNWTESGGNGAAMRIQPHVWAAASPSDPETFLGDVLRNAVCTHSHPNGLLGATIHALALAHTIATGRSPSPDELLASTDVASEIQKVMERDFEVGHYWMSAIGSRTDAFDHAWLRAIDECRAAIRAAADVSNRTGPGGYSEVVNLLKLRDPARRGSGVLTAIAAVALTWCEPKIEEALVIAVNELGTDTDTIATMAGAILGIVSDEDPPVETLDADLFRAEANRMSDIAAGLSVRNHMYPDLLHWAAPKTRADSLVCMEDGSLHVLGMGDVEALASPIQSRHRDFQWQWVKVDTGQTLLIKRRKELAKKNRQSVSYQVADPQRMNQPIETTSSKASSEKPELQGTMSRTGPIPQPTTKGSSATRDAHQSPVEDMFAYLERHNYEDLHLGRALRRTVEKGTIGEVAAFVLAVVDRLRSQVDENSEEEWRNSSSNEP